MMTSERYDDEDLAMGGVADAVEEGAANTMQRRTILKGAAWSLPVIAMAVSVPMAAATGTAAGITVDIVEATIPSPGTSLVTARVVDVDGNGLVNQLVTLIPSTGADLADTVLFTDADGYVTTTLTIPVGTVWPGTVTVTAQTGELQDTDTATVTTGTNAYSTRYSMTPALTAPVFPSPVKDTVTGNQFQLFLLEDGTVWSVGENGVGQLGLGDTTSRTTPTQIPGLAGVAQIVASGNSSYALLEDGTVRSWGANSDGKLGNGSTTNSSTPVTVSGLTGVIQIAAGGRSAYALLGDGTVRAWGGNQAGALGRLPINSHSSTPVTVSGLSGVTQIAGGATSGYALLGDGTVRAWGGNQYGQLGNGSTTPFGQGTVPPVTVSGLSGVTQIAGGYNSGYALLGDGTVRSWGRNQYGALGDGSPMGSSTSTPVTVPDLSGVTQIAGGSYSGYALLPDGTVRAWGEVPSGGTATPATVVFPAGTFIKRVGSGFNSRFAGFVA